MTITQPLAFSTGRFHESWSLRLCTWLGQGNDPRYTPTTTFQTFPFPPGLTPNIPAIDYGEDHRSIAITAAARRLVELRDRWLNPPEWAEWVDEPVPGYPKRLVPRDETAAKELKKRTLTNLYNARPQWLADAHAALDAAVAAAYGWDADISEEDALGKFAGVESGRVESEMKSFAYQSNVTGFHRHLEKTLQKVLRNRMPAVRIGPHGMCSSFSKGLKGTDQQAVNSCTS